MTVGTGEQFGLTSYVKSFIRYVGLCTQPQYARPRLLLFKADGLCPESFNQFNVSYLTPSLTWPVIPIPVPVTGFRGWFPFGPYTVIDFTVDIDLTTQSL